MGWNWSEGVDKTHGKYVDFTKYSPVGENFSFTAWGNSDFELATYVLNYAAQFDVETHAMELKNGNMEGVPDLETLLDDAKEIKKMLDELADALKAAYQART